MTHQAELAIIAGWGHDTLAGDLSAELRVPLVPLARERFPDSELSVRLLEPVRGRQAVIVQPTGPPVDAHLLELLALADACRRSAADRVIAVVPYFGYARGDRRSGPGAPIMASLAATLLQAAGVDHVVTVDLHAPQIEGFFNIPVDDLAAFPVLLAALRERLPADVVVVSPDLGRIGLATRIADELATNAAVIHKRRISGHESEALQVVGDVAGRPCLIVDDMISTGGTVAGCVDALVAAGARPEIVVAATHGLFLPGCVQLLSHPAITQIWVTDSLPRPAGGTPRHQTVTIAPLIASALDRLRQRQG